MAGSASAGPRLSQATWPRRVAAASATVVLALSVAGCGGRDHGRNLEDAYVALVADWNIGTTPTEGPCGGEMTWDLRWAGSGPPARHTLRTRFRGLLVQMAPSGTRHCTFREPVYGHLRRGPWMVTASAAGWRATCRVVLGKTADRIDTATFTVQRPGCRATEGGS